MNWCGRHAPTLITWDGNIETIKTIDPKYILSQRFDVTIFEDDDGNLVSDKTPAEILEAYNNGQIVNGTIDKFGINLSLSVFVNNGVGVIFTAMDSNHAFVRFFWSWKR